MVNSNWIFFRCDLCGEGFARNEGLKKHTLTHKINEGNLTEEEKKKLELQKKTCEFCGRKFDHPSAFYRHRKTHMGIKNHICSECGQAFTEKRYMDDHYNVKHLGLKNYPCEHCGKLFGSHNSLANHKKSIHGIGPSPQSSNVSKIISWLNFVEYGYTDFLLPQVRTEFACDVCGKTYKSKGARHTHYDKAHLGDKKLPCKECGLVFERSGALQAHMKQAHPLALAKEGECKSMMQDMQAVNSPPNNLLFKTEVLSSWFLRNVSSRDFREDKHECYCCVHLFVLCALITMLLKCFHTNEGAILAERLRIGISCRRNGGGRLCFRKWRDRESIWRPKHWVWMCLLWKILHTKFFPDIPY